MAQQRFKGPKGTQDFLPDHARRWQAIERIVLLSLVLTSAALLGCGSSAAAGGDPSSGQNLLGEGSKLSQPIQVEIDEYLRTQIADRRIPGVVCGIMQDGRLIHVAALGLANVQHRVAMRPDTVFEIASLTKAMTAAAVLILVDEGRVGLDEPIGAYLADVPAAWRQITVRHLLNHTSGLRGRFSGVRTSSADLQETRVTRDTAESALRGEPLEFTPPGDRYLYSDPGYFLLGRIIENASGRTYREFMHERILSRLGMSTTTLKDSRAVIENEAQGYTVVDGELRNIGRWHVWDVPAAFGVMSDISDLARWDAALDDDSLLSASARREMFSVSRLNDGTPHPYGLGWNLWTQRGHRVQQHEGRTGTEFVRIPDSRTSVIVLTNLGGEGANSWGMAMKVAEMVIPGLRRAPLDERPVPADIARAIVGEYEVFGETCTILSSPGGLFLQFPNEPEIKLVYLGGDRLAEADEDVSYTIIRDGSGAIVALLCEYISGRRFHFSRKISPQLPQSDR